jgi:hypothetical protein
MALAPFLAQAAAIGFDEFYFHHRRGLPRWERIGHPLDTATILACFGFVLLVPYAPGRLWQYVLLALFSTLFVTKDEFVHAETCGGPEHWLHALLFALHPVVLASAACLWPCFWGGEAVLFPVGAADVEAVRAAFVAQVGLTGAFFLYQVLYWNGPWTRATPPESA